MKKIAILVLAAGTSSRMKKIKQLLKINSRTLLENTLKTAKSIIHEDVFCVLGANATTILKETYTKNIHFIFNKYYKNGLSTSIVAGLHHFKKNNLTFDGILIMLADQPDVDAFYLKEMITIFSKNKTKIIATSYNNFAGVPAIFPKKYIDDLMLLQGDKGAKEFLQKHFLEIITINRKQPFKDLDTQEEYELYLRSLKK